MVVTKVLRLYCQIARAYMTTRMPALQTRASHALLPVVPVVSNERMVSMIGVNDWFSAKPRRTGVIELVGTKDGLMKISNNRM